MKNRLIPLVIAILVALPAASDARADDAASQQVANVEARVHTAAAASAEIGSAAILRAGTGRAAPRILAATALGGIETYSLAGKRIASVPAGEVAAVDVGYGVHLGRDVADVVAAIDTTTQSRLPALVSSMPPKSTVPSK